MKRLQRTFSLILFLSFIGCSSREEEKFLRVGTNLPFVPFEFRNEQGELEGYDIDLIREIARRMERLPKIEDMAMDALVLALKQKRIDCIIAGLSVTEKRLQEISLIPYRGVKGRRFSLLFWKEIPREVDSLERFSQLYPESHVGVQIATTQADYLDLFPALSKVTLEQVDDLLLHLKYGKLSAILVDYLPGTYLAKRQPEIRLLPLSIETTARWGAEAIGVHKKNDKLRKKIEELVEELYREGFLDQLEQKWMDSSSTDE